MRSRPIVRTPATRCACSPTSASTRRHRGSARLVASPSSGRDWLRPASALRSGTAPIASPCWERPARRRRRTSRRRRSRVSPIRSPTPWGRSTTTTLRASCGSAGACPRTTRCSRRWPTSPGGGSRSRPIPSRPRAASPRWPRKRLGCSTATPGRPESPGGLTRAWKPADARGSGRGGTRRSRSTWQDRLVSEGALSPSGRADAVARLEREEVDVLVVGGGITGVGIALDAASRAASPSRCVEADDLAAGTSSRSSKLIHGGLRYWRCWSSGSCARRCVSGACCSLGSRPTSCGRSSSCSRCGTGAGSDPTSGPACSSTTPGRARTSRGRGISPIARRWPRRRRSGPIRWSGRCSSTTPRRTMRSSPSRGPHCRRPRRVDRDGARAVASPGRDGPDRRGAGRRLARRRPLDSAPDTRSWRSGSGPTNCSSSPPVARRAPCDPRKACT